MVTAGSGDSRPPVVAVVGPTAAGKTELSLDLAEALGGEIVNTDAMQVYRGMDIGTAKVPPAERRGIPHHLLDVLDVTEPATVAEFQRLARAVIDDCRARGVDAGAGRRLRAVHPGVLDRFEFPGTDPSIRARLDAELGQVGPSRCTAGSPQRTRRPPERSCPATVAGWCGRSR
jgi:tRNA dimethylallyltransferase